MRNDAEATVEGVYCAWRLRDRTAMLAYFTGDAVLAQHISTDLLPFAGVSMGKARLAERIDMVFRDWTFERLQPSTLLTDGNQVRAHVDFAFRYRPTGELLEGRMRHVFSLDDGRIAQLDEYHDAPMVEAFIRLANASNLAPR